MGLEDLTQEEYDDLMRILKIRSEMVDLCRSNQVRVEIIIEKLCGRPYDRQIPHLFELQQKMYSMKSEVQRCRHSEITTKYDDFIKFVDCIVEEKIYPKDKELE
jgi:hypothetical protein